METMEFLSVKKHFFFGMGARNSKTMMTNQFIANTWLFVVVKMEGSHKVQEVPVPEPPAVLS